jgi:hypothetical protein
MAFVGTWFMNHEVMIATMNRNEEVYGLFVQFCSVAFL